MIRAMTRADFSAFWPTFQSIIQAQETYAFDPDRTSRAHIHCGVKRR